MTSSLEKKSYRLLFSYNVRCARKRFPMTQELMGKKCGLDRTYISSVERGLRNISIDNMEKMAKAVNKTVPELLVDEIDSTE